MMQKNFLLLFWLTGMLLFQACGHTPSTAESTESQKESLSADATALPQPEPKPKQLILYIHGYNSNGADKHQTYGDIKKSTLTDAITLLDGADFKPLESFEMEDFTSAIAMTTYYGDTPPAYYSDADIADVEAVTERYGGGIPRYALIIAKFIRHALSATHAQSVTIISGSMGSLVTRWLIEKNVANLASDGYIDKWLSINGVIRGNYLASQSDLAKWVNEVQKQPIDVRHISYQWIEANLHAPKSVADSPYYKTIQMGAISSTQAGKPFGVLMKTLPNDGYQAVRDTYFKIVTPASQYHDLPPTHTYFHQGHIGIKDDKGAWLDILTFLRSKKRVRITLNDVAVAQLHEKRLPLQHKTRAEVVFASTITSPAALREYGITDAISQRTLNGGTLPVHHYANADEPLHFSQILYDDFVLMQEEALEVTISGYELDDAIKYGIHEPLLGGNEKLGSTTVTLPLQSGTYPLETEAYRGTLKVEIFDYR